VSSDLEWVCEKLAHRTALATQRQQNVRRWQFKFDGDSEILDLDFTDN
jgi:hypothetical protein